jgi:hypothetical protein
MRRKDELPPVEDRDRDRIPDDDTVAESIKDVADTFKTDNVGKDIGIGGIGATDDDEDRD